METSAYKEFSYRMKGFRALSCLVATVTVILCLLVGIGCWILVAGVRENEHLLNEAESVQEKLEVEIVEGNVQEPLHLAGKKEPLNKVGRVVQHIAEIDFAEGRSGSLKDFSQHDPASPASVSVPNTHQYDVVSEQLEESQQPFAHDFRIIQETLGEPISVDGVIGVRLQPPSVDGSATNFMSRVEKDPPNNGQYMTNDLPVVELPAAVYSASYQEPLHTQSPALHRAFLDSLVNFTAELSDDIATQGLFDTLADRSSEKYMRQTFQWIGDYTSQLMSADQQAPRSKRSLAAPLSLIGRGLAYANYAAFGKFMMNEVSAIAEYNIEARKFNDDPTAEFLDSNFWASPSSSPASEPSSPGVLTAATDNWQPQVNKISLKFIGEMLNTLLNMMREYLMKDHVMECLWFMFCEDLNHQAQYADVYGLMARVNSVGLKVLTQRENRHLDTIGEVWRAMTAWETLQCEPMFPKCDGPKALEIVNEVALGTRK